MNSAPTSMPALKAMAQRCIEHGAFAEALAYYDKIVQVLPGDAQAHYARGTILRRLHRLREALAALAQSAELAEAAPPQLETADLLLTIGRPSDAIPYCEKALAADPEAFNPNLLMARALCESGRAGEAELFWTAAEQHEPSPGQAALAHAMYLANKGQFSDAEKAALRGIELAPDCGRAYYALFASRRVTEADRPLIEQIRTVLDRKSLSPEDRIDLLYALGKALDNLGDFESAIGAFDSANKLQKQCRFGGRPFDRSQLRRMVDRQIEWLNRPIQQTEASPDGPTPIFVVGMARSGTTLVDQILSSHPKVGSVGEQPFWMEYQRYAADERGELRSIYEDLLGTLAPDFPFVVDKNPTNLFVIGLIRAAIPNAKIIGMRRDPVDTALSIWTTQMHTDAPFVCDRDNIVFASKECLRLMEHCRQTIPTDRYLEVDYEDLAQDPEKGTRAMLDFIGLEWDERCAHPEQSARSVSTPSFWQVRQPIYRSSVGRRKNYEPYLGVFAALS